jgi:hypothetical protein
MTTQTQLGFRWTESQRPFSGQLLYVSGDYAINFRPSQEQERDPVFWDMGCSIALQTLEVHLACGTGTLLFPSGYFPKTMWKTGVLPAIRPQPGIVRITKPDGFTTVGAVGFKPADHWRVVWDARSGWLRFGEGEPSSDGLLIEFAEGVVAALDQEELKGLWLRPGLDSPL